MSTRLEKFHLPDNGDPSLGPYRIVSKYLQGEMYDPIAKVIGTIDLSAYAAPANDIQVMISGFFEGQLSVSMDDEINAASAQLYKFSFNAAGNFAAGANTFLNFFSRFHEYSEPTNASVAPLVLRILNTTPAVSPPPPMPLLIEIQLTTELTGSEHAAGFTGPILYGGQLTVYVHIADANGVINEFPVVINS